jgi:hypothetical protein
MRLLPVLMRQPVAQAAALLPLQPVVEDLKWFRPEWTKMLPFRMDEYRSSKNKRFLKIVTTSTGTTNCSCCSL